jgi:hypothetical protein
MPSPGERPSSLLGEGPRPSAAPWYPGAMMTPSHFHHRVYLGGRSGPQPCAVRGILGRGATAQRPLFHSARACVSSIAAAARHGRGGSCCLRRAGWPALTQPRASPRRKATKAGWRAIRPSRSDDGEAPETPVTAPAGQQGGEVGPAARGEGSLQASQRQHRPGRLTLSRGWSGDQLGAGRKNSRAVGPPGRSQDQGGYQTRRAIPAMLSLVRLA